MNVSNLALRVATAAVALPALLAALYLGPPVLFSSIAAAAVLIGMREMLALIAAAGLRPLRLAGWLVVCIAFVEAASPRAFGPPIWPAAVLLLLASCVRRTGDLTGLVPSAAATLLGAAYLGGLGGTIAALRILEPTATGAWRVTMLLAVVMMSDTFAFFTGHAFGRRPLAPSVSPGKTVEGAAGGLVGGIVGALAVRAWGLPLVPTSHAVTLGLVVSAFGIAGDLFESQLKRWAGVKDSGVVLPGHGGILDRLDSLLFGGPVVYYYFSVYRS